MKDCMTDHYIYQDKAPYPKLCVCGKNAEYAQAMLGNIGEANSEMSAISRYLYGSMITNEAFEELAECFHKIMIVEMHHLDLYGKLAMMLGADPRLWSCQDQGMVYWSPDCLAYPGRIPALLEDTIHGEEAAIAQYRKQAEWIQDQYVTAVICRIIKDEELHLAILKDLLGRWERHEIF